MMTKIKYSRVFAVCSLALLLSLFSVAGARADKNYFRDHNDDNTVSDGTIYDAKTGLTWQKEGHNGPYTWQQALAYVETLNAAPVFGGCSRCCAVKRAVKPRNWIDLLTTASIPGRPI